MAKKFLVIAGAGAAVLAGAAVGTLYWQRARVVTGPRTASAASVPVATPTPKLAFVTIQELTLRLADTDMEHYIKLTPVLAVRAGRTDDVTAREPIIRDRIITLVSARSSTELCTPQGEAKLKHDIIQSLRHDFGEDVDAVYFSGYLVE